MALELPHPLVERREHKLEEGENKTLNEWLAMKRRAQVNARNANRRYSEADAIFTGIVAKKKYDLGWSEADNVVYDEETGRLVDVAAGTDENGVCLNCGQKHDDDD